MFEVQFEDSISPSLLSMARLLDNPQPTMEEIGQLMTTWVREAHESQRGLSDSRPFHRLSSKYAKAKLKAGGSPARVLFGPSPRSGGAGGDLFASWGIRHKTPTVVVVGSVGGTLEKIKASAHDGGLAQYLGRPELNRLRFGWTDELMRKVIDLWMDKLVDAANEAEGGKAG